jgi:hypothetical protein
VFHVEPTTIGARKVDAHRGGTDTSVSRQWVSRPQDERFLSLDELCNSVFSRYRMCRETTVPFSAMKWGGSEQDPNLLALSIDNTIMEPTNWSFGQLCSALRLPAEGGSTGCPPTFLRALPTNIAALNLNVACAMQGQDEAKAFIQHGGAGSDNLLRAATSPSYGRIPDAVVALQVQDIAKNGPWKVPGVMDWRTGSYDPATPVTKETTTLFASDRDVWMFLCDDTHPIDVGTLRDGSPDLLFRGFIVSNSETGAAKFRLSTMYLRGVCCNRILWGVENKVSMEIRHNSRAPERFGREAAPHLESFTRHDPMRLLQGVRAAKAAVLASDEASQVRFLRQLNFSETAAMAIITTGRESIDGDPLTAWGMAQAITRHAQAQPFADKRFEIESVAGKVLDAVSVG